MEKESFVFSRELYKAVLEFHTYTDLVEYAVLYGLGKVEFDPRYADICAIIDRDNGRGKPASDEDVKRIVGYLNEKMDTHYRASSDKTRTLIMARFREGHTLEDFRLVIDSRVADWKDDPKMRRYLRPETLFSPKFEGYLQEAKLEKEQGSFRAEDFFAAAMARSYGGEA